MKQLIIKHKQLFIITFTLFITVSSVGQIQSDTSIKKNITSLSGSLSKLIQLEPKSFEYNTHKFYSLQQGLHYGFLAENVQAVFPGLVHYKNISYPFGKNSYRSIAVKEVDEQKLIPLLVASIKEQQQQINALKAEISQLKSKVVVPPATEPSAR
ncbi:MAG: tail fiber domain-containing protein [Sphingobacteriales bacterium]|nr:MAG: tail fiber domain-containing protein [Sphingobacteriales bacterium]